MLVAFSPDGKFVFPSCSRWSYDKKTGMTSYGSTDRFQICDTSTGEVKQLPAKQESAFTQFREGLVTHMENFCQAVFSSDGKRLFSGDSLVAWDMAGGDMLSVLESPGLGYYAAPAMALSPDDNTLATCHESSIQLWDVSEPKLREVLDELKQRVADVDSGRRKHPTEPATRPRVILRGHADHITAIAFHPDGKILASASFDRTIKLWDVVTGEVRLTLEGHAEPISSMAFTPDGNTLISTDTGRTVKVWRAVPAD
jgi:WD40 repeat protein